jgi:hypothetical protein
LVCSGRDSPYTPFIAAEEFNGQGLSVLWPVVAENKTISIIQEIAKVMVDVTDQVAARPVQKIPSRGNVTRTIRRKHRSYAHLHPSVSASEGYRCAAKAPAVFTHLSVCLVEIVA